MRVRLLPACFFLLIGVFLLVGSSPRVELSREWQVIRAHSGLFTVRFPGEPQRSHQMLRTTEDRLVFAENLTLTRPAQSDPERNVTYFLNMQQTLGDNLIFSGKRHGELFDILELTTRDLIQSYVLQGGRTERVENVVRGNVQGKRIRITLPSTRTGVRINLYLVGRSMVLQSVIGPAEDVERRYPETFLHSLEFAKDRTDIEPIKDLWVPHKIDWRELFTVWLPPVAPPYMVAEPTILDHGRHRAIGTVFTDPVRNTKIVFNTHFYTFGEDVMPPQMLGHIVNTYHAPQGQTILQDEIQLVLGPFQGTRFWSPAFPRNLGRKDPIKMIHALALNNYFGHSYIIVQEIITTKDLIGSPFVKSLVDQIELNYESESRVLYIEKR